MEKSNKGNGLIPDKLVKLLNYRINQEELSSRLYYAMHEWLENQGYFGAARMMEDWAKEETEHAEWSSEFLESYDYLPEVGELKAVETSFSSLKDVMMKSYDHEVEITEQCNDLAKAIAEEGCYCVMPLALKYLKEQTDEMDKVNNWLSRLNLVGNDPREIMMIDREMGRHSDGPFPETIG